MCLESRIYTLVHITKIYNLYSDGIFHLEGTLSSLQIVDNGVTQPPVKYGNLWDIMKQQNCYREKRIISIKSKQEFRGLEGNYAKIKIVAD